METIKQVLMRRDGLSEHEANAQIEEAKAELSWLLDNNDFESAEQICEQFFGLEPDYLPELIEELL